MMNSFDDGKTPWFWPLHDGAKKYSSVDEFKKEFLRLEETDKDKQFEYTLEWIDQCCWRGLYNEIDEVLDWACTESLTSSSQTALYRFTHMARTELDNRERFEVVWKDGRERSIKENGDA